MNTETYIVQINDQPVIVQAQIAEQPIIQVEKTDFGIAQIMGGVPGPAGQDGAQGIDGAPGPPGNGLFVKTWNLSLADDRAEWQPSVDTSRRVYSVGTDSLGRQSMAYTFAQATPAPTVFTQAGYESGYWYMPDIAVLAGDRVTFHYIVTWTRTANSLVGDVNPEPFGNPGYSVADDRSGLMIRAHASVYSDDSEGSYWDIGVMEPRWDYYAGIWLFSGGYFHPIEMTVIPKENCNLSPYVGVGPVWANVAGHMHLVSASVTIAREYQEVGGPTDLAAHIQDPEPHPAYDVDIPSLTLLFENGLV